MARLKERSHRLTTLAKNLAPAETVALFLHRVLYDSIDAVRLVAGNEAADTLQAQSWRQLQALADGLPPLVPRAVFLKSIRNALQILQETLPGIVADPGAQRACYGAMRQRVLRETQP